MYEDYYLEKMQLFYGCSNEPTNRVDITGRSASSTASLIVSWPKLMSFICRK